MKRALISVFNKKNLNKLVPFLDNNGYKIFSSGGTYDTILQNDLVRNTDNLKNLNTYFDFPEQCDGRVKTLHPSIFGGILDKNDVFFDLVAVNLYPEFI